MQDVSLASALLSQQWGINRSDVTVDFPETTMRTQLSQASELIRNEALGWSRFFGENGIVPVRIRSQDVNQNGVDSVKRIAEHFQIGVDARLIGMMVEKDHRYEKQCKLHQRLCELWKYERS